MLIANDDLIAGILNRNGLKTGNGNRWTRERVTSMRLNYRIPVFKPAKDRIEPLLNLSNAAKLLQIAPKTLRLAAETGEIEAIHPLPDGPWDLRSRRAHDISRPNNHRTGTTEPKIPRGIAKAEVPAGKLVQVVLDNYAAHKHPKILAWLDRHPRFTFHFTPTPCSWLNGGDLLRPR